MSLLIFSEEERKHLCFLFILVPPGMARFRAESLISWLSNNATIYYFYILIFDTYTLHIQNKYFKIYLRRIH